MYLSHRSIHVYMYLYQSACTLQKRFRIRSYVGPRSYRFKTFATSGMSVNSSVQLEQRYGAQLRQAPFSGASTTRILWRMIKDQLPRCTVSEGLYFFILY